MSNPCLYHPALPSVGTCIQCGTPGCAECLETIGGKLACRRCAGAIQSRLAAQTVAPNTPPRVDPRATHNPNAGLNYASLPSDYVDTTEIGPLTASQLLKGIALATTVGVLGAVGIEKMLFYTHLGFALFYLLLGAAVSGCLRAFTGRGGPTMALIAAGIMIVCLGISHVVYVQDFLTQLQGQGDAGGMTFATLFPLVMGHLKFVHWMFVLGSVILCFITANQESKRGF